jgi:hypothetical protein
MATSLTSRIFSSIRHSIPSLSRASSTDSLPRIAQPAVWQAIIPKFLRPSTDAALRPSGFQHFIQNPSTHLITLAMLAGSQAIQLIQLQTEVDTRKNKAKARLATLKDLVERVQRGDPIGSKEIKEALGTGDPEAEREWQQGKDPHLSYVRLVAST